MSEALYSQDDALSSDRCDRSKSGPSTSSVSSLRAAQTSLLFAEIDLADPRPGRLRAYGEMSEESSRTLEEIRSELGSLVKRTRELLEAEAGAPDDQGDTQS